MNIIIFILIVAVAAVTAILISQMQVQINKLSAMTEENSGRIFEIHALEQNNETRIKKISSATHTEIQKMWVDQDSTILKLEEIAKDIKRLDELEKTEEDTRQNLLAVAEQVKKNQHNISEISAYYCNYVSKPKKEDVADDCDIDDAIKLVGKSADEARQMMDMHIDNAAEYSFWSRKYGQLLIHLDELHKAKEMMNNE